MVELVAVTALTDNRLQVTFSDDVVGELDLSALIGRGVFSALRDPAFFRSVSIGEGGEITWGGKVDMCADAAYLEVTGKRPEDLFPGLTAKGPHA